MNLVALLAAAAAAAAAPAPAPADTPQPAVGHVWTIVLENKDYEKTFGADSQAPYLARDLVAQGALLTNYYATGHLSLDNYISMVSGQAPNPVTQSDCQLYQDFLPPTVGVDGQAVGQGCVYPKQVLTVADQLVAKGLTYRGYMEDMGADPERDSATCAHPPVGARDNTQSASEQDQYATRHNPFVYFHSIVDDQASCDKNVVNLDRLPEDLRAASTTPAYSFITPDLCSDGHDETCADPKQKGGYEGIDEFLREWVPQITASPAFKKDGLLIVTFDEAEDDDSACCEEPTGPNTPRPGINGPGGGRIGAILLSPLIEGGVKSEEPVNHYGYLRSMEDLFGLEHLGYAAQDVNQTFQSLGIFSEPIDAIPGPAPAARPVKRFRVRRKGGRLVIRVRLAAGVVGRLTVKRRGLVVKRFTTGGKATLRVRVPRHAKVILRARQGGKTVKTLVRKRR